ncbi:MAG TPA: HAMP domain-containing sensor histidine kinase [Pseudonocardiaceae bacterium]
MIGARRRVGEAGLLRHMTWQWGLQIGACVAVIVAVLSGLAVLMVLRSQESAAITLLTQATAHADDVGDAPAGMWLVIVNQSGTKATNGLPAGLPDRAALTRVAASGTAEMDQVPGGEAGYQAYTQQRGAETVQAVLDLRVNNDERERLLAAMLFSGAVGLLLAAGAGAWFGRRSAVPVAAALMLQRRFVSDASHELRTPLTHLSIRAQLLRRHFRGGTDATKLGSEVDGLVDDTERLAGILDDLLLAADPRTGADAKPVDIVVLAAQVVAATAPAAAEQAVTITTHPERASLLVLGSPGGLRRALTALLDNAVRHARAAVSVTVRGGGGQVVVDIGDDGPGIDPEILPHLFERFTSTRRGPEPEPVDATGRRHYGIGLALVGEIADRHNGGIAAINGQDGGATLRLTLPLASE